MSDVPKEVVTRPTRFFVYEDRDRMARVDGIGDAQILIKGGNWQPRPALDKLVFRDPDMSWDEISPPKAKEWEERLKGLPTHVCSVSKGAGDLMDRGWCIDSPRIRSALLGLAPNVTEEEILCPELKLCEEGTLTVYYVPFERVNPEGKVMIVGLTPGRHQMWLACKAAACVLRSGGTIEEALDKASATGGFAGVMRTNLISMLDDIGVARWLGLSSTKLLWEEPGWQLEASTSAVQYAVFRSGKNYSGSPAIAKSDLLRAFVQQVLAVDLELVPQALVIPLGKAVSKALELIPPERLNQDRVLLGFPHPSGANGHRKRQFAERRDEMAHTVTHWASHVAGGRQATNG
jgi:hypothetical protein